LTPLHLAGRDNEQNEYRRVLKAAPEIPGNVRLTGLRGVGKTVLLHRFKEIGEEEGWATLLLEVQPRLSTEKELINTLQLKLDDLAQKLSTAARIRARVGDMADGLRRVARVDYEGFEWSLAGDLEKQTAELGEALLSATNQALEKGRAGLAILLDEAQVLTDDKSASGDHPLSTLIAAVSTLQKERVPISLVLCGLPTLAVNLLNARTYTERMFRGIQVDSLDNASAREALVEPLDSTGVTAENDLVESVLAEVEGYPYFIQLWGAELWDATRDAGLRTFVTATLDEIRSRIYRRLDLDFYEPRVASLTPAEQDLLLDSARCSYPPLIVAELNAQSPKSSGNVNVLLGRLVSSNVLFRPRKGQYQYTAPGFRDFLKRRNDAG